MNSSQNLVDNILKGTPLSYDALELFYGECNLEKFGLLNTMYTHMVKNKGVGAIELETCVLADRMPQLIHSHCTNIPEYAEYVVRGYAYTPKKLSPIPEDVPEVSPVLIRRKGYYFGNPKMTIISNLTRLEKIELVVLMFAVQYDEAVEVVDDLSDEDFAHRMNMELVKFPFLDKLIGKLNKNC
jgi:hypothetical protein